MKLNPDCLRDIMLTIEPVICVEPEKENGRFLRKFSCVHVSSLAYKLSDTYSKEEAVYHIVQLSESGYILTDFSFNDVGPLGYFRMNSIYHITPKGHDFIAATKEQSRWSAVSSVLKSFGAVSLTVIETVAKGVASAAIEEFQSNRQV